MAKSRDDVLQHTEQAKERIVEMATRMFHTHGIKSVRMDDIAKALSMSKRTLYLLYSNKQELLSEVVKHHEARRRALFNRMQAESENVIDVLLGAYQVLLAETKNVNPLFFEELEIYPEILSMIRCNHRDHLQQTTDLFHKGVEEGYLRKDLNFNILQMLFEASTKYLFSDQQYKKYSVEELFRSYVFTFLRGMCTAEGLKWLDDHDR
jgi:AcrR family transcriptional regulator